MQRLTQTLEERYVIIKSHTIQTTSSGKSRYGPDHVYYDGPYYDKCVTAVLLKKAQKEHQRLSTCTLSTPEVEEYWKEIKKEVLKEF